MTPGVTLRVGDRVVLARAPRGADLEAALGPLLALREDDARVPPRAPAVEVELSPGDVPAAVRAAATPVPPTGAWVDHEGAGWIVAKGAGGARLARDGRVTLFGDAAASPPEAFAEHVAVPALAERLRRDGVFLVHAAVVETAKGAWIVPAARGGGKTTLALSLARAGAVLRSDDRAFLLGATSAPRVDPWPEPPRVGERTRFLLPAGTALAAPDPRTGKALAPALRPSRPAAPLPIRGVLLPRLVKGAGGIGARVQGARVLSAVTSQAVVVNDPATASATLAWLAAALGRLEAFDYAVGTEGAGAIPD